MGERPLALISGGSSGIGLAAADHLLRRGFAVLLLARGLPRLEQAQAQLRARYPGLPDDAIGIHGLDIRDHEAIDALIAEIEGKGRPIEMVVASAGIAEPGLFLEQPFAQHIAQMEVNYLGTLKLAHAAARVMAARKRGRLVLIASGAALVGVYGYAAYAPSKFAVRGLGECLQAELAEHGIEVSIAYPPDTDTPQYAAEQASKPEATKQISAVSGLLSADTVAGVIIKQALAGKKVIAIGLPLRALRWVHSLYAPYFIWHQARLARKIARKG